VRYSSVHFNTTDGNPMFGTRNIPFSIDNQDTKKSKWRLWGIEITRDELPAPRKDNHDFDTMPARELIDHWSEGAYAKQLGKDGRKQFLILAATTKNQALTPNEQAEALCKLTNLFIEGYDKASLDSTKQNKIQLALFCYREALSLGAAIQLTFQHTLTNLLQANRSIINNELTDEAIRACSNLVTLEKIFSEHANNQQSAAAAASAANTSSVVKQTPPKSPSLHLSTADSSSSSAELKSPSSTTNQGAAASQPLKKVASDTSPKTAPGDKEESPAKQLLAKNNNGDWLVWGYNPTNADESAQLFQHLSKNGFDDIFKEMLSIVKRLQVNAGFSASNDKQKLVFSLMTAGFNITAIENKTYTGTMTCNAQTTKILLEIAARNTPVKLSCLALVAHNPQSTPAEKANAFLQLADYYSGKNNAELAFTYSAQAILIDPTIAITKDNNPIIQLLKNHAPLLKNDLSNGTLQQRVLTSNNNNDPIDQTCADLAKDIMSAYCRSLHKPFFALNDIVKKPLEEAKEAVAAASASNNAELSTIIKELLDSEARFHETCSNFIAELRTINPFDSDLIEFYELYNQLQENPYAGIVVNPENVTATLEKIYAAYSSEANLALLEQIMQATINYNAISNHPILKEKQIDTPTYKGPIAALAIAPAQRGMRYVLLLKEIQKKAKGQDYLLITQLVSKAEHFSTLVNEQQRLSENTTSLLTNDIKLIKNNQKDRRDELTALFAQYKNMCLQLYKQEYQKHRITLNSQQNTLQTENTILKQQQAKLAIELQQTKLTITANETSIASLTHATTEQQATLSSQTTQISELTATIAKQIAEQRSAEEALHLKQQTALAIKDARIKQLEQENQQLRQQLAAQQQVVVSVAEPQAPAIVNTPQTSMQNSAPAINSTPKVPTKDVAPTATPAPQPVDIKKSLQYLHNKILTHKFKLGWMGGETVRTQQGEKKLPKGVKVILETITSYLTGQSKINTDQLIAAVNQAGMQRNKKSGTFSKRQNSSIAIYGQFGSLKRTTLERADYTQQIDALFVEPQSPSPKR